MTTEKFCTKCGRKFIATGREVICPSCKAQAAEDAKRAAVLRAKKASWAGESVPVRISGRASTVIRAYGKVHNLPFAAALDDLLKATSFAAKLGDWEKIEPYKSRRLKKSTEDAQEGKQEVQEVKPQEVKPVKPVKQAAKTAAKTSKASKASKATKK